MSTMRTAKWNGGTNSSSNKAASTMRRPLNNRATSGVPKKKSNNLLTIIYVAFGGLFVLQLFVFYHSHSAISNNNNTTAKHAGSSNRSSRLRAFSGIHKKLPSSTIRSTSTVHVDPGKSLFTTAGQRESSKVQKQTGKVLHRAITHVSKKDLDGLMDASDNINNGKDGSNGMTYEEALKGREEIVAILNDAGVTDMDADTITSLPEWSSVTKLYGDGPVVIGLETCKEFRDTIPLDDASIGTAGMFNTGTNPFAMYIEANCKMPHNTHDVHGGTRWQVPWGKHTIASRRLTNTAGHDFKVNKTNVLPIVLVRDPYSWMQSMCKHEYVAKWPHAKEHCPNLVPNASDRNHENESVHVTVKFNGGPKEYDSLVHLWSSWYREYYNADFPRLMVRFEDLQFHAREMIDVVCQCAGAVARNDGKFTYIVDAAKWGPGHTKQKQTNLISAMIKYGSDKNRFSGMTEADMKYAGEFLDPELMHIFQYEVPAV